MQTSVAAEGLAVWPKPTSQNTTKYLHKVQVIVKKIYLKNFKSIYFSSVYIKNKNLVLSNKLIKVKLPP